MTCLYIHLLTLLTLFGCIALDKSCSLFVISENGGLASGSCDQHCSIRFLHSGSHLSGTGGLNELLTIPPA